jgi:hypothetical protein
MASIFSGLFSGLFWLRVEGRRCDIRFDFTSGAAVKLSSELGVSQSGGSRMALLRAAYPDTPSRVLTNDSYA